MAWESSMNDTVRLLFSKYKILFFVTWEHFSPLHFSSFAQGKSGRAYLYKIHYDISIDNIRGNVKHSDP